MKESDIRSQEVLDQYLKLVEEDVKKQFDRSQFECVTCPACGKNEYTYQFEKSGFKYVTCNHCGTLYANPRPTQGQLDWDIVEKLLKMVVLIVADGGIQFVRLVRRQKWNYSNGFQETSFRHILEL